LIAIGCGSHAFIKTVKARYGFNLDGFYTDPTGAVQSSMELVKTWEQDTSYSCLNLFCIQLLGGTLRMCGLMCCAGWLCKTGVHAGDMDQQGGTFVINPNDQAFLKEIYQNPQSRTDRQRLFDSIESAWREFGPSADRPRGNPDASPVDDSPDVVVAQPAQPAKASKPAQASEWESSDSDGEYTPKEVPVALGSV
jgi:hypothetical protein